jgi:CBS domain-containing protein
MNDIASICQRHVITIAADATLKDAALRMREHPVGALVVTATREGAQQVVGVLTDRDLAIEALARGGDASRLRVSELALGAPVSVPQEASLAQAVERMSAARPLRRRSPPERVARRVVQ